MSWSKTQLEEFKERNSSMVQMREQGQTYAEIGETFNVTNTRVQQICAAWWQKEEADLHAALANLQLRRNLGRRP